MRTKEVNRMVQGEVRRWGVIVCSLSLVAEVKNVNNTGRGSVAFKFPNIRKIVENRGSNPPLCSESYGSTQRFNVG